MNPRITAAVAARVLTQLRHDRRTLVMLLVVPSAVLALLAWIYAERAAGFDPPWAGRWGRSSFFSSFSGHLGPALRALIPFIVMFLVTSVTMLRERASGTLERLLAMPMGKLDLLLGYG